MAKHTPGPWHYFPQDRYFPRVYIGGSFPERAELHGPYIIVNSAEPVPDMDGHEANARLIAAAPDLLDALNDAAIALAAILDQPQDETRRPHAHHLLERAREVLAKAEGRSAQ